MCKLDYTINVTILGEVPFHNAMNYIQQDLKKRKERVSEYVIHGKTHNPSIT